MSNPLAIAAATLTLRSLLAPAVAGGNVTLKPPDSARGGADTAQQLNLFLYQTLISPAWRNAEMPRPVRSGEQGPSPLGLSLHYLITAYGDSEADSHAVLGRAMSALHDHMLLSADDIRGATQADLPDSDLHRQTERVRITPLQLSVEEISKLWSGFSTHYRLSAAYEVSVVLIESRRPAAAPLPVLAQGRGDRGPYGIAGGEPRLEEVRAPGGLPAAPLGSVLRLLGTNLEPGLQVRLGGAGLAAPLTLSPLAGGSAGELQVQLPGGDPANAGWAAGFYTFALVKTLRDAGGGPVLSWASNELPFGLAPTLTVDPLAAVAGTVNLTLTCKPRVREGQRVLLLFAGRQVAPSSVSNPADPAQPTTLQFSVPDVPASAEGHPVRLRVDGVDSLPMRPSPATGRLEFDPAQRVVVT